MKSKTAVLSGGVVLLLVGALLGYVYGVSSAPSRTSTTTGTALTSSLDSYNEVAGAYANQLLLLVSSKNASAVAARYESNATIQWRGNIAGLEGYGPDVGNYTGTKNITAVLGIFLTRHEGDLIISNETQAIEPQGNRWVVSSFFDFAGNSSIVGGFEGTVVAQDSYAQVGNAWLIAMETWNFLNYTEQFPASSM
ncbi:MAG: hypothetical protein OK442_08545 [Thaumarchaeota archaeon]|jgi:hypothetical protein|nr:hypothetical protein [Nitrososphaerota archaeon]